MESPSGKQQPRYAKSLDLFLNSDHGIPTTGLNSAVWVMPIPKNNKLNLAVSKKLQAYLLVIGSFPNGANVSVVQQIQLGTPCGRYRTKEFNQVAFGTRRYRDGFLGG